MKEGVIKFSFENEPQVSCSAEDIVELEHWRSRLRLAGLVGQHPDRYEGYGYGNLSRRLADGTILITASQTGHLKSLTPQDYTRIVRFEPKRNRVWSRGIKPPSSESLTHLAMYAHDLQVQFVFHAHCPKVWCARDRLKIPTTDPKVEYGTPEMFAEVQSLLTRSGQPPQGLLAMGGHVDGLLAWGETAESAGEEMFSARARVG